MEQATEKMIKVTADAGTEYIPGILVLAKAETDQDIIDCEFWKTKEGNLFYNDIDSFHSLLADGHTPYQPIIILETRSVLTKGEKYYSFTLKKVFECTYTEWHPMNERKVLALPSHFTPDVVRFIKIHKIKNGDKVLVRVDEFSHTNPNTFYVQEPLALIPPIKDWEKEFKKCKESPWYFATNYYTINGEPFTTRLNEKEFNEQVNNLQKS